MKNHSSLLLLISLLLIGCQKDLERRIVKHIEGHCVFQKADTFYYDMTYLTDITVKSHGADFCCDTCIIDFADIFNKNISDIYVFSAISSELEISEVIGTEYKEFFPTIMLNDYKQIYIFMNEGQIVYKQAVESLKRLDFCEGESVYKFSPQSLDKFEKEEPHYLHSNNCDYLHYPSSKMKVVKTVLEDESHFPTCYRLYYPTYRLYPTN